MTVKSGFFNSIGGDRKYDAAKFAEYFGSFVGNGIFPQPENGLKINSNSNMTVTVQVGKAWINGYFLVNDDNYILTIENADGALNRIDRIVARYDVIDREIRLEVKKGTFSSNPVASDIQRDSDAFELALADVYITAGTTSIAQANITDLRSDKNYCGIVDSLIAGNVNLLSERIDNIEDGTTVVQNAYSANNAVIAQRATKLDTARKINGVNFDGTSDITISDNTKAPINHASTANTYGLGTSANYGHVKVRDDLVGTETSGATVSPAQIKGLNDLINSNAKYTLVRTLSIVASGTGNVQVVNIPITDFNGYNEFLFVTRGNVSAQSTNTSYTYFYLGIASESSDPKNSFMTLYSDAARSNTPLPLTNLEEYGYGWGVKKDLIKTFEGTGSSFRIISPAFMLSKDNNLTVTGTVYLDIYRKKNR